MSVHKICVNTDKIDFFFHTSNITTQLSTSNNCHRGNSNPQLKNDDWTDIEWKGRRRFGLENRLSSQSGISWCTNVVMPVWFDLFLVLEVAECLKDSSNSYCCSYCDCSTYHTLPCPVLLKVVTVGRWQTKTKEQEANNFGTLSAFRFFHCVYLS